MRTQSYKTHLISSLYLLGTAFVLSACSAKQPVLYPNAHYKDVGKAQAQQDIAECRQLADNAGVDRSTGKEIAQTAAGDAAIGAAAGAGAGVVRGDVGERTATGAAAGAAVGATRATLRSGDPDPIYKRFVEKCLRDRGYEPIGWR